MRRFAFLAACLMAAGVLAGCGGDPEPGDTIKRQTYESAEVQFTAPAEGDTIAIFDTSAGEVRAVRRAMKNSRFKRQRSSRLNFMQSNTIFPIFAATYRVI